MPECMVQVGGVLSASFFSLRWVERLSRGCLLLICLDVNIQICFTYECTSLYKLFHHRVWTRNHFM